MEICKRSRDQDYRWGYSDDQVSKVICATTGAERENGERAQIKNKHVAGITNLRVGYSSYKLIASCEMMESYQGGGAFLQVPVKCHDMLEWCQDIIFHIFLLG